MFFTFTSFSIALFLTTVINFFVMLTSWQRKDSKGGLYFALGITSITFWTLVAGLDYAAVPIPLKIFFAKLEYIGYHAALVFLIWSVFSYVGYDQWLSKRWFKFLFSFIPLSNILLVWTNDLHGLIWSGFRPNEFADNVLIFEHGPAFTWIAVTGYLLITVIIFPLWLATRRGSELFRRQARILFYASLIPIAGNIVYLLNIPSLNGVDWASITFSVAGFFFLIALYGARFLDIVPVARHALVDGMDDCILVLDTDNRIVDFNLATEKVFGISKDHLGESINTAMDGFPAVGKMALASSKENHITIKVESGEKPLQYFDTRLSCLEDRQKKPFAKLIVFRNITKRHLAEHALAERAKELKCIYDLSLLVETPDISLEEIFAKTVQLVAVAMQFPEHAWARIRIQKKIYLSDNYQKSINKLTEDISVAGRKFGVLEVGYNGNTEKEKLLLFLQEEENLLLIMAERLGDIIQDMQAEERLRENEELLRTIAENYPNSFLSIVEKDLTISFSSGREFKKQNLDPIQFIGMHIKDIFGDQVDIIQEYYEKTFDGEEESFELFINDQYQLYNTVPLYANDGSIKRILSVVENITERVLAEQKLKEAQGQVVDQQRTLAKIEERQRMARDLHDSVSQSIHSMVLFSETLAATLEKGNYKRAKQIMVRLEESARQSHKETRLLLYELQAEGPKRNVNLVRDLEERLARVERHTGVKAKIIQEGSLEYCPQEWHENLFWITIEALNNTLKHAQAHNVQVMIHSLASSLKLNIIDDGIGFDTNKNLIGGIGLENMRTRAELIGGQLEIESELKKGTTVRFFVEAK